MLQQLVRPIVAVVACVGMACAGAAAQNEFSMKPELSAGQQMNYILGMNMLLNQETTGQGTVSLSVQNSCTIRIFVAEISPEGEAKLDIEFTKVMLNTPGPDRDAGFLWPAALPLTDDSPADHKLGPIIGSSKVSAVVDAAGKVRVVGGFESFMDAASKVDLFPDDRLMGFFTPEKFAQVLTPIFEVDGAGASMRAVGKAWQRSETIVLPPVAALEMTTDYVVHTADGDMIEYGGVINTQLRRPEQAGDDVPTVRIERSGGGDKGTFDRRRKLLSTHKKSLNLETVWRLGDAEVKQMQTYFVTVALQP